MATGRLDRASRETLTRVTVRLCALLLYVGWLRLADFASPHATLELFRLGWVISAVTAAVHALRAGEKTGHGGLNHWDEAAAYCGLAIIADLAVRLA